MSVKEEAIAAVTALGDGVSPMAAAAYALGFVAGKEHAADGGWTEVSVEDAVPSGALLGMGNPLLDFIATVDDAFLAKYKLKSNDAILAEEPHQPLFPEVKEKFDVMHCAGGATQNSIRVAQWMLGVPGATSYIGAVGKDAYGKDLATAAQAGGVNVNYYEVEDGTPTGTCAVLITGHDRSLCTNLGAANKYDISHAQGAGKATIDVAQFYYISGFFLTVSPPTIEHVGAMAAAAGKTFTMNLAAPFICQFFKDPLMSALKYCDIVFGNESEFGELSKTMGWEEGSDLKKVALKVAGLEKANDTPRIAVCTQGKDPTIIAVDGVVTEYAIDLVDAGAIVDTNGAGDAYVGGFMAALVMGKNLEAAHKAGAYAAGVIICQSGCTMPEGPVGYTL